MVRVRWKLSEGMETGNVKKSCTAGDERREFGRFWGMVSWMFSYTHLAIPSRAG